MISWNQFKNEFQMFGDKEIVRKYLHSNMLKPVPERIANVLGLRSKVRKSLGQRERFNSLKSKAKVTIVPEQHHLRRNHRRYLL